MTWRVMRLRYVFHCESYFISIFSLHFHRASLFALLPAWWSKSNVMCTWLVGLGAHSHLGMCIFFSPMSGTHFTSSTCPRFENVQILCNSHWHLWLYSIYRAWTHFFFRVPFPSTQINEQPTEKYCWLISIEKPLQMIRSEQIIIRRLCRNV